MAESVEDALDNRHHLIVEAGPGPRKTLAYLVPIIRSGRRVVISTGTKNLQEQLFWKDIPFLKKLFPKMRVTLMKGRQNYLCRQKLYDLEKQPVLNGMEEVEQYAEISEWEKRTETGDRAELGKLPDSSELWARIDARRELCTGQKCPQFERCFITLMHQRAAESDIIIVNHHLFFADLAIKDDDIPGILPDYHAVVFDEAHEIEDVASQYFGVQVSNYRFQELRRDIARVSRQKQFGSPELDRITDRLEELVELFFSKFGKTEGRTGFEGRAAFLGMHLMPYTELILALDLTRSYLKLLLNQLDEVNPLIHRADELMSSLK